MQVRRILTPSQPLPPSFVQLPRCGILDIPQHHVRRFLPAGLHNGERVEPGDHHVLGSADAHGVTGQFSR
jgi:hypothetical protein